MDTRLRGPRNTSISAGNARRMPTPQVQTTVVRQRVSLKPYGNTIALTVPAEMPFVSRNVTVRTQMSGGMAGPDPRMQSQRPRGTWRPAGRSPFAGLGDAMDDAGYRMFNQNDPDAANMSRADYEASDKKGYWEAQVTQADLDAVSGTSAPVAAKPAAPSAAAPAADSGFSWSKAGDIFSTTVSAGTNIYSALKKPTAAVAAPRTVMTVAKSNMTPILIVGGLAALGLVAFLMLRKKGAAAAA